MSLGSALVVSLLVQPAGRPPELIKAFIIRSPSPCESVACVHGAHGALPAGMVRRQEREEGGLTVDGCERQGERAERVGGAKSDKMNAS